MSVLVIVGVGVVTLRVEAEGHYNWLHASSCSVWEFQASPRRDIPVAFRSSFFLTLGLFEFVLAYLGVCSVFTSLI